ncbi:MAG: hypothetical protein J6M44_07015 [Butyrivibrio sp.]|nr:hypothetical protein [Butyrivibrio sp.]
MSKIDFTKLDTYRRIFDGVFQIKGEVNGYSNLPVTAINGDIYKDKSSGRLYAKSDGKWLVTGMTEDDINLFSPEVYANLSDVVTPKTNVLYLIGPKGTGEDKYEEYIYNGTEFVKIGDTTLDISSKQDVIEDLDEIREGALAVPDWNQNDSTEPDYIKNRTHYTGSPVLRWTGDHTSNCVFSVDGVTTKSTSKSWPYWYLNFGTVDELILKLELNSATDEYDLHYSYIGDEGVFRSFASSTGLLSQVDGVVMEGLSIPGAGIHKLDNKYLNLDSEPTSGSSNPVTSGSVFTAISAKQDVLVFDDSPTASSDNPVTSGGVYTAVNNAKPVIIRANQAGNLAGDITLTSPTTGLAAYRVASEALSAGRDVILALTQTNTGRERLYRAWAWKSSNQQNINFQADITGSKISFSIGADGTITNDSVWGFYEQTGRKVTAISASSTDEQYPSAKAVYTAIGDIESALNALL